MFAIGLLSLLGMGVAMSMSGGGDDADVVENGSVETDAGTSSETENSNGDVLIDFVPEEDTDPEDEDQLADFDEGAEEDDALPTEDVVDELQEFLDGLEDTDEDPEIAESEGAEDDGSFVAPPMGDEFRDPLIVAEELEAQRIADEIAAEEARQPENLVTVSEPNGDEVSDEAVLEADPDEGEEAFIVTAPEGSNNIEVAFDHERTFDVTFNENTSSIVVGLNSDLNGPDGITPRSITNDPDDDGVIVRELTWTKEFENRTEITVEVEEDHIGTHISQIDLLNPNDELHFEFGPEVTGNLHLVYSEVEDGQEGDSSTVKSAYVIRTDAEITSLTANDVARILAAGEDGFDGAEILSEIYLGEDSIFINGEPGSGEPYEVRITNFINENPMITSNIEWASVTEHDDDAVTGTTGVTTGEPGNEGDGEDDDGISELFEDAGLNPGFFGF